MQKEYIIIQYYNAIKSYHLSFTKLRNCENDARGLKFIIAHCIEYSQPPYKWELFYPHFVIVKNLGYKIFNWLELSIGPHILLIVS